MRRSGPNHAGLAREPGCRSREDVALQAQLLVLTPQPGAPPARPRSALRWRAPAWRSGAPRCDPPQQSSSGSPERTARTHEPVPRACARPGPAPRSDAETPAHKEDGFWPYLDTSHTSLSGVHEAGSIPVRAGAWDIAFLAIDPGRANDIAFTAPYVVIEGTYLVPADSPLRTIADVDREGVRVAV